MKLFFVGNNFSARTIHLRVAATTIPIVFVGEDFRALGMSFLINRRHAASFDLLLPNL